MSSKFIQILCFQCTNGNAATVSSCCLCNGAPSCVSAPNCNAPIFYPPPATSLFCHTPNQNGFVSDPGNSLGVTRFSQNQQQIYHHQQVNNNPRNSYYNSNNLINPADCSCYYAENHHPVNNPRENNLGAVVTGISGGASDASGVKCSCDLLQSNSFNQQSSYPSAVHQLPQQQHGPHGNSSFSYNVISGSGHHQPHPASSGLYHHSQVWPTNQVFLFFCFSSFPIALSCETLLKTLLKLHI